MSKAQSIHETESVHFFCTSLNATSGDDKKKNRLFKKPRGRQRHHNDLRSQPSEVTSSHTNQVSYVLVNINRQDDKSNELSTIYNTIR